MQNVSTCLWFNGQAAQAATFYTGLFPNSRVIETTTYLEGTQRPVGSVLTVQFSLDGTEYLALNGGPQFTFSPAMSLVAYCDTQQRIDFLWGALLEGGYESQCGWLTDRFGVSWQVVPRMFMALLKTTDKAAAQRVFSAMMTMRKLDITALQKAYDGV